MLDALVELLAPVPASSTTIYIADDAHNTRATDIETAHAGDCCVIDADHHLVWAVSPTASSVISLSEIQNNITTNHLRLQFPCPILPHVATVIHQRTVMLFALGTNGHVYRITLAQHQSGMLHSIQQHTRNQWLHVQPLGFSPSHATCMIAAHGCLVIGSADGVLLCAPLDDVAQGDEPLSMVELRDTGNTLGRLFSGLLSRAPTASLVSLAPLAVLQGSPRQPKRGPCPVVALYSDSVVRVWDLDRHTVMLAAQLPQLPQLAGTRPVGVGVQQVVVGGRTGDNVSALLCVQHARTQPPHHNHTGPSTFTLHTLHIDSHTSVGGCKLATRCVVGHPLQGVVSFRLALRDGGMEGASVWALCSALDGPQAWRADVDDPDCPWAPVMLVEDAWKLLHAHDDGSDDDHINADHQESVATLHDALLARVLQEDAQGGPQQGPQLLGVVRDVLHGLLGGTPALAGVLEAAVVALGGGAGLGRGQRGEAGGLDAWVDAAAATVIKLSKADTSASLGDALRQLLHQLRTAWAASQGPCAFAQGPLTEGLRLVRAGGACSVFRGATPAELVARGGGLSDGGALGGALSAVGEQLLEVLKVYRGLAGCWTLLAVQAMLCRPPTITASSPSSPAAPPVAPPSPKQHVHMLTTCLMQGPIKRGPAVQQTHAQRALCGAWSMMRNRSLLQLQHMVQGLGDALATAVEEVVHVCATPGGDDVYTDHQDAMHSDGQNNTNTNPQALWTTAQQITAAQLDVCVQLAGLLKLLTWSSDDRDGGSNGNGGDGGDGNAVDTPSMLLMPAAVVGEVAAVSQQVTDALHTHLAIHGLLYTPKNTPTTTTSTHGEDTLLAHLTLAPTTTTTAITTTTAAAASRTAVGGGGVLRPLPLTSEGARGGGDAQGGVASVVVQTCVEQTGQAHPHTLPHAAQHLLAWLAGPPGGGPRGVLHATLALQKQGMMQAAWGGGVFVEGTSGAAACFVKCCCLLHALPKPLDIPTTRLRTTMITQALGYLSAATAVFTDTPQTQEQPPQERRRRTRSGQTAHRGPTRQGVVGVGVGQGGEDGNEEEERDTVFIVKAVGDMLVQYTGEVMGCMDTNEGALLATYEALLMLSLQQGASQAVSHVAQRALALLDTHPTLLQEQQWQTTRGRLWSNVFLCALEGGAYEEAYSALLQQPIPTQQIDCLQRLVHALANVGAIRTLCTLPFAGTVTQQPHDATRPPVQVPMARIVHSVLSMRAATLDLGTVPQPHKVLYAWCVSRGEYRLAAAALMGALARGQQEGLDRPGVLQEQHATLVSLCTVLQLLPPHQAWVRDPRHPPTAATSTPTNVVCTYTRARQEASLAAARVVLWRHQGGAEGTIAGLGVGEMHVQLCSAGLYTEACTLVRDAVSPGPTQDAYFIAIVQHIAAAAARAQRTSSSSSAAGGGGDGSGGATGSAHQVVEHALFGTTNTTQHATRSGTPPPRSPNTLWASLRTTLEWHAVHLPRPQLRVAVVDAALAVHRDVKLPAWLVCMFEGGLTSTDGEDVSMGAAGNPAALMQLYIKYGRPGDAAALLLRHMQRWAHASAGRTLPPLSAWFPYNLVPALQSQLESAGDVDTAKLVQQAVDTHMELVQHKSAMMHGGPRGLGSKGGPAALRIGGPDVIMVD